MGTFINQVQQNNRLQEKILNNTQKQQNENKKIRYKKYHAKLFYETWQLYIQDLTFEHGEKTYTFDFETIYSDFIDIFLQEQKNKNFQKDYEIIEENWIYNKKIKDLELQKKYVELADYIYIDEELRLKCKKCYYSIIKKSLKLKETLEEQKAILDQEQQKEQNIIHVDIKNLLDKAEKKENEKKAYIIGIGIGLLVIYCYMKIAKWIILL